MNKLLCEEEKDELTLKIIETAQSLFTKHGIENVSMHQLAKAAEIGQGTLYRRYSNKNKLCHSMMKKKFHRFIEELEDDLQTAKDEPVVYRLTTMMTKVILLAGENLEWVKAILNSDRLQEAKANRFEMPAFVFIRDNVRSLLEEATYKEELLPLDITFTSDLLASAITPELIFSLNSKGYTAADIAEQYCRSFVAPLFKNE